MTKETRAQLSDPLSRGKMSKAVAAEMVANLLIDIDHRKVNYVVPPEAVIDILNSLNSNGRNLTIYGVDTYFYTRTKMFNLATRLQQLVEANLLHTLDLLQDDEPMSKGTAAAIICNLDSFVNSAQKMFLSEYQIYVLQTEMIQFFV